MIWMLRMFDKDERLADVELIDGMMVFRRVVDKGVISAIESVRRGRSDNELYHCLPQIFSGQCWVGYVPPDEQPGPDDEIVEPESLPEHLRDDEIKAVQQRVELSVAKDGPPSDADLMKEIDKMNATAPK
jgi:hypothetical protein